MSSAKLSQNSVKCQFLKAVGEATQAHLKEIKLFKKCPQGQDPEASALLQRFLG